MKFILGTKKSMTQVFREDGTVVPVTRVHAGPCVVTQIKTKEKSDLVNAVQIGFGEQKAFRLSKAAQGHLKGLATVRYMRDIKTGDVDQGLKRGDTYTVSVFTEGEKVQVTGTSKGKGFQGVVKRHGFRGSPASHGHKDQLRMPGSIGATGPARVFKGTRMGGHMGVDQVTVKNLEIIAVDEENNELLIKGAIPGARGGLLVISTSEGAIEIATVEEAPAQKDAQEEVEVSKDTEVDVPASEEKKDN
ncbi:50S ribosomal protein L3 [Patescibacteria group bacterium]|nr:50S ribosomal protein L3 [Patescibacteria group bacterium]MBU1721573.1 50S ribosomal protein L3 [Patescibacteria group bacterium]MBU1901799.1 50S ribosomal protein L3 [Patescibacteria group bacterium]